MIPSLVNACNASQMVPYSSDMTWRHEHPTEIFAQGLYARLQLFIHPMWWTSQPMEMLEKWRAALHDNQRGTIDRWRMRELMCPQT